MLDRRSAQGIEHNAVALLIPDQRMKPGSGISPVVFYKPDLKSKVHLIEPLHQLQGLEVTSAAVTAKRFHL